MGRERVAPPPPPLSPVQKLSLLCRRDGYSERMYIHTHGEQKVGFNDGDATEEGRRVTRTRRSEIITEVYKVQDEGWIYVNL